MERRSLRRRTVFLCLILAGGLGVIEGFCRVAERTTDVLLGPFEIEAVPEVLGFDPHHEIGHLNLVTYANEGGYNGAFYPVGRTPNTLRIAALGDSFTFGWGVQAEEAWPALLETRLDEALEGSGVDAEVLNFGVPGYNTWLSLLHWRRVVSRYKPDVVLLGYYSNDAVIDRRVPNVHAVCPLPAPALDAGFAQAQEVSAAVRVAHDLYWVSQTGAPLAPWSGAVALHEDNYGFRCSMEWAEQLADDVEAAGARFAVIQLPHMEDLDDGGDPERAAQARLTVALESRSIATDDLYKGLVGRAPASVNNADAHPNVQGNEAIAAALWPVTGQWLLAQALARSRGSSDTPQGP